ncbi:uncharacterized protein STEHIDRAFT_114094 [Stereum hirsutum FP-91666 SS1]|uniref:uncharacterized protein n=1 Tax=Stereum hirsutum (strain FP-91666) TaxID=721885 RepID=UPI0004449C10|nr:uncharacterized protein STEHIDRAFT_114094 [Stereum hirsutum FP-91666 SS1]EIM83055.1 hypothetical protein STEHIDRAFT_114094 [Stereum hirsutum FP-91666 SS1]
MLHSTTSTSSFIVNKYSRSHPSPSANSSGSKEDGVTSSQNAEVEWQHFTNPTIRLVLDIKKASTDELESVRLRILWYMDSGGAADFGKTEPVVFEDVDLFSFSSLDNNHTNTGQGLPLKAVYRDCVVGIRYLHPQTVPLFTLPIYRRFQVTFDSAPSANQFINAIRPVCPCKTNSAAAPVPARAGTMAGGPIPPGPLSSVPANRQMSMIPSGLVSSQTGSTSLTNPPRLPVLRPAVFTPAASSVAPSSSPSGTNFPTSDSTTSFFSLPVNTSSSQPSSAPNAQAQRLKGYSSGMPTPPSLSQTSSSSLPASSPPRPSSALRDEALMPPPPLPTQPRPSGGTRNDTNPPQDNPSVVQTQLPDREAFLDSLRDTPALYDLSRSELEKLVCEVIREPGFLKLLEKLDTLWAVKGALDI